jgi:hypothetical protein
MNESAPAPVLPPVPRWERVAAGVLAVMWISLAVFERMFWGRWWDGLTENFAIIHNSWRFLLAQPTVDLSALINSRRILLGVNSGLIVMLVLSVPPLILWAAWRAIPRAAYRGGVGLWWVVFGHGALAVLYLCVWSRKSFVVRSALLARVAQLQMREKHSPAWYEGWFGWVTNDLVSVHGVMFLVCFAEILLAALVLWFTRQRRQKPSATDGTVQA